MKSLSRAELLRLLSVAKATSDRDWLMILVAYWHGLRASEVVALTAGSIADGFLTVQRLKGSLKTVQPLIEHPELLLNERAALIEYSRFMLREQRLFPITRKTLWAVFQRHGITAEIPKHLRHPHIAKHSIARHMIDDAGVHHTKQWLGHRSLSSTGEYLKVTDDDAATAIKAALCV